MQRRMTHTHSVILALLLSLLCCVAVLAQGTSAAISGVLIDSQHAVLPGATITIKNLDTGQTQQVSTNHDGYYRVTGLPPGHYEIRAALVGFETHMRSGISLTVAQETTLDFTLTPKLINEEVTVTDDPPTVDATGSTLSSLVDEKSIRDLPLNGRDITQLALLQPGIVTSRTSKQSADSGRGARLSAAGARPNQNLFTIDGTIINDALNNTPGSAQGLLIGVETIKEFRVFISAYDAGYSRATGAVLVAITKSGTNNLHGSAFEFFRDDALDARNFFDQAKPNFRRNQFGFTLGGPVVKDRTFFFGSYEGLRETKGITQVSVVPDDGARVGILPGLPAISVDSRSKPLIDLFPRSNGKTFGDGTGEFIGVTNRESNDDFFTIRVDRKLSNNEWVMVRYLFDNSNQILPHNFAEYPNLALNKKQVATIQDRRTFANGGVNEFRFGFSRSTPAEVLGSTRSTSVSLITGKNVGEIAVGGLTEIGNDRSNPKRYVQNDFQLSDDVLVSKGRQSIKLGIAVEHFQVNGRSESRLLGRLRFRTLTDLLRFRVRDLEGASPNSDFGRAIRQSLFGTYFQDDLKVSSRLMLNLGLRYEVASSPSEVNDKFSNLRDVLDSKPTLGAPYFKPSRNELAPRIGFAWDVFADGRTVVRGGFGIFYEQPLFNVFLNSLFRTLPFENRGVLQGSQVSSLPVSPSAFVGIDRDARSFQFKLRPTYFMHYNLSIQRELPGKAVLTVAYLGSQGVNLLGQGDLNTAVPQRLSDGRDFFPEGSKRRNPNFDRVRGIIQGFNSSYNAINISVVRRSSKGVQWQASYNFGKSIDDRSGELGREEYSQGQALTLDPYNRALDRGRSDFDTRHIFVADVSYDLPLGTHGGHWIGALIGGWQINGILTASSGLPVNPFVDGDPDRDGTDENAARPNVLPGVSFKPIGGSTPENWFNIFAFVPPDIGFRGTSGRNIVTGPGYFSADLSLVKNFSLREKVSLQLRAEAFNLFNRPNFAPPSNSELGEQVFAFSPASSGTPASFTRTATAGRIFSTNGDAREVQLGIKVLF